MFKRVVNALEVLALLLTAVLILLALFYRPTRPTTPWNSSNNTLAQGAQIFSARCSACHGSRGEGQIGPRLAGAVATKYPNAADEVAVVTKGRNGMPAWGDQLTPAQIDAVVTYTRNGL